MSLTTLFESMATTLGENLPSLIGALAILVLGWFVAVIVRAAARKSLSFIKLNQLVQGATESKIEVEGGIAKALYYLILLIVLVGFFSALQLPMVSESLRSLVDQVFAFAPRLVAAGALAFVAWVLAILLKRLASKALASTGLDRRMSEEATRPVSDSLGHVLYWLVILLFLPGILGALGLEGLLGPVQSMVEKFLALAPNLFAAAAIALVGWFVARLLRDLVTNLLSAAGTDNLGRKAGLSEKMGLSRLLGIIVYVLVLVPTVIAALDAVKIEAISRPATDMLDTVMTAIPNIFGAAIILLLAYVASRFAAGLTSQLLEGVGFNELPRTLGFGGVFRGETTPSVFVGRMLIFFAMVFATVEAANRLGFGQVSSLVATFIDFSGQVLLGGVIIVAGMWISGLVYRGMAGFETSNAPLFATVARFAILGLVFAMGLRAMGIADSIVNLAFGLTLGAIAVAVALSFGLGGREAAGRQMEHWLSRLRGE